MKVGELHVTIWNNLSAEDALGNSLQDEGLLHDLVVGPVQSAVLEHLREDFGRLLDIDVEVIRR